MSADCATVKVAVRIRPFVKSEMDKGCQSIIEKVSLEPQVLLTTNDSSFTFNYVFSSKDTQEYVYESCVKHMIHKLFEGYNVTILAYGQTGSGKTHTMGTAFNGNFDYDTGVIPRAVYDIFEKLRELDANKTPTITCSFVELYQEQLYDLLSPNSREQSTVDIREDGCRGIVIPNLTEKPVTSAEETTGALIKGSSGRAVGATAMNAQSSRSHAIFTINVNIKDEEDPDKSTSSKFHLVDLAGSERAQKTKATGDRFKEGVKINQGLLALGNVISALGSGSNNTYVGYRDSKLTRLLQDSLGGNSLTLMIACVSPADYNLDETLSTLRYADRARKIKNKPIVNQDPKAAEINRLNNLIQKLRMELMNRTLCESTTSSASNEALRKDLQSFIDKNRLLQQQLQITLQDVAENEMRAAFAEGAHDEIQQKFIEFKENIFTSLEKLDTNSCPVEFMELPQKIQNYLIDFDGIMEKTKEQMLNHKRTAHTTNELLNNSDNNSSEIIQQKMEAFTTKQLDFNNELRRLNRELNLKEELHERIAGNLTTFSSSDERDKITETIKELESKIQILEAERSELNDKLKCAKSNPSAKLAEERRRRLNALEEELNKLKKANTYQAKLLQVKQKDSIKIETLRREIQEMKATKVRLVRSMKAESENFRQWKLNKEKELTQLKAKGRRLQYEMVRKESMHNKQSNVLKRKVEEAMAANKRLKDALDKQKAAQMQRKKNNSEKVDISWVEKEVDVIVSLIDAQFALNQLMEDRACINSRLKELKESETQNVEEIELIENELEMRNAQINDMQQKMISSDVTLKLESICEGMHNLPEAKSSLKRILSELVKLRNKYIAMKNKNDEYKVAIETAEERIHKFENEIEESELRCSEKLTQIVKDYEEKISVLLRELNNKSSQAAAEGESTPEMTERIKIQQEVLDKLDFLNEELERYKQKCQELENNSFKKPRCKRIEEVITVNDYFELSTETDDDLIDNVDEDPDWKKTPLHHRSGRMVSLEEYNFKFHGKEDIVNKKSFEAANRTKRSSNEANRCSCSSLQACSTNRCSCRKNMLKCSENCRCGEICTNRYKNDEDSSEADSTTKIETNCKIPEKLEENDEEENVHTPKKLKLSNDINDKLDVTTPSYPYANKQRKPFFD